MNWWRGLNMLPNQEERTILNKNALLRLLAYSPKLRGAQPAFSHPIRQMHWNWAFGSSI
jgi:hypothetical protein